MSAMISGNGLGLFDASLNRLGGGGIDGSQVGQGRNHQYVNIATGNLVLQSQDEQLLFRGLSIAQVRTYNSLGALSQTGADGWLTGFERRVELTGGALNTTGSVVRRHVGDGSYQDFTYAGDGAYVAPSGDGAHDSMTWDAAGSTWRYIEGSSRREETYADHADAALQGRLIQIRDLKSDGTTPVTWDVLYDASNRIAEIRSNDGTAAGDALVFGYDVEGRLATLATREAEVLRGQVTYGYDSADRLTTVLVDLTPSDGSGDREAWDTTAAANNDGYLFRTVYTYVDATSLKVASVTQSDGTIVSYTYDAGGRIGTLTRGDTNTNDADGAGHTLTFTYDAANRSTDVADSTGRSWRYGYDAAGQLNQIHAPAVDGLRDITGYAYDAAGNITQVKTERGGQVLRQSDFQYDSNGNLLWQWEVLNPGVSASATAVQRTYTADNQLASETRYVDLDPDGVGSGQAPSNGLTTHYAYDAQNRLRFVVNANGDVKEIEYFTSGNGIGQQAKARQYLGGAYAGATYTLSELTSWATNARKADSTLFESSYDLNGRLSQTKAYAAVDGAGAGIEDDASEITNYVYDAQGLLRQKVALRSSTVVANDGRDTRQVTAYSYDGMGRVLSEMVTEQVGSGAVQSHRTTTWAYLDSANSLRTIIEVGVAGDGLTTNDLLRTEVRNAANELIATTESAVTGGGVTRTTLNFYDAAGRLRAAQDAGGGRSYFFYDAEGALSAQVDESGALVEFIRDDLGRIVTTTSFATHLDTAGWLVDGTVVPSGVAAIRPGTTPEDRTQQVVYDATGRLLRQIDAEGAISSYSYDGAGRLLQVLTTDAAGTAATARLTRYFHDAAGRQTAQLDAEGYLTEYRYDSAGRKVAHIGYANATALAQRASGTLEQLRPLTSTADQMTRYFHDGRGQLVAELDAEGYLTEFVFDHARHQRAVKAYAKQLTGLTGAESLLALRTSAQAAGVRQTLRSFDALGRLVTELNAEGTVTRYSYDAAGRLLSTQMAVGTSEVREGNRRYDVFGNLIGELGGEGSTQLLDGMTEAQLDAVYAQYGVRHNFDALGRRIESIDAEGNKTWYFYDAVGRLTQTVRGVIDAQGVRNAEGEVTETRYTAFGDVQDTIAYTGRLAIGSPFGRDQVAAAVQVLQYVATQDSRVEYTYDRRGQLTERVDAQGYRDTWRYTAFGDLDQHLQQIDGSRSLATEYAYDRRGLRATQVDDADGLGRSHSWSYDAFGRVASAIDGRGNSITFGYDRLGRQVSRSQAVSGRTESTATAYDAYGRTLTQTDALGRITAYQYNDATRSVAVTTPEGVVLTTHRTRHGETWQVVDALGNRTEYLYDADGQLVQTQAADGGTALRHYDARGLLARTVDAAGREIEYSYDAVGRLLQRIEDPDPTGLQLTTTYAYDGQGRQVSVTDAAGVRTLMTYDRNGHLSEVVRDASGLALTTTYAWDGLGQKLRVTEGAGTAAASTVAYAYDALGRRISETVDPGAGKLNLTTTYGYDGNDNVVSRTDAEGRVTRYTYDEADRQVFAVDGAGGVVRSWYDANGRVVATRAYAQAINLIGLPTATTTAAIQSLLTSSDPRDVQRYRVHDGDGRLRLSIDGAGAVTQWRYDTAGRQVGSVRYADPASLTAALRGQLQSGTATESGVLSSVAADPTRDQTDFLVLDRLGRVRFTVTGDGRVSEQRYDLSGRVTQTWIYATVLNFSAAERTALAAGTFAEAAMTLRVAPQASAARVQYVVLDAVGRERYSVVRDGVSTGVVSERRFDAMGRVVAQLQYGVSVTFDPMQSEAALAAALQPAIDSGDARQTAFVYDQAGRQRFVIDATRAVTESRYDATGRVTQTLAYGQRPSSSITTGVELEAWAQSQASADVRSTRNAYDAAGRLQVRTDALNQTERYEYDGSGLVVAYTNRNGHTWNYEYDAAGRRDAEISPQVSVATVNAAGTVSTTSRRLTTRIAYDALGNVTARTENAGTAEARITQYVYDNRGNQIRTIFPDAWKIDEATGELEAIGQTPSIEVTYDAMGRAVVQQDVRGHDSYKVYDAQGRLAFEVDQEGFVTGYSYNAFGEQSGLRRYATRIDTTGLSGWSAGQALTLAQMQTTGVLTSTASDRTLSTTYGPRGNKLRVVQSQVSYYTSAGVASAGSPTTQFSYDAYGDLVGESVLLEGRAGQADARWADTFRYYDALGRNTFTVDAEGYATTTRYNATGEVVEVVEHARALDTEGLVTGAPPAAAAPGDAVTGYDRVQRWTYDALGRKVTETQVRHYGRADGTRTVRDIETRFGYDNEGRVTELTTEAGTTRTQYNALGQAITVAEPARAALVSDAETRLLASTANSLIQLDMYESVSPYTAMSYDAFGNLVRTHRYANGLREGQQVPATSAQDQIHVTRYDRQGRAVMVRDAEGNLAYSAYDAADNMLHRWYRLDGSVDNRDAMVHQRYAYDGVGRQVSTTQTRIQLSDGSESRDIAEAVVHNGFGEITQKTHAGLSGTLTYGYDAAGRLIASNENGGERNFGYNLAGHQVRSSRRAYLSAGQSTTAVTSNTVDQLGRAVRVTLPPHATDTPARAEMVKTLDRWGNVLQVVDGRGYQTNYQYNGFNQIVRDERPMVEVVSDTGVSVWTRPVNQWFYDAFGRLVATRDANGNLRANEYDDAGRLQASKDAYGNATHYAYDALGNQRITQNPLGYLTFRNYDRLNRVVAIGDYLPDIAGVTRDRTLLQGYVLNQNGDRLKVTDALNYSALYDYDSRNSLLRSETSMGLVADHAYDTQGHKVWQGNELSGTVVTDRDGEQVGEHELTWDYDVHGRLLDHNDLSGRDYNYAYDVGSGMQTTETAHGGPVLGAEKTIEYYVNGKVRRVVESAGAREYRYEYDAAGNRTLEETTFRDRSGQLVHTVTRTLYDSHNRVQRVVQEDLSSGTAKCVFDLTYEYDAVGNRRHVTALSGYGPDVEEVTQANTAPVVANRPSDRVVRKGMESQFRVLFSDVFRDAEQDRLVLEIGQADGSALPAWLSVAHDAQTGEIVFTAQPAANATDQDIIIKLVAKEADAPARLASTSFVLKVRTNTPPVVRGGATTDLNAKTDRPWSHDLIAADYFRDDDVGDQLTLSIDNAAELPAWLQVDASSGSVIRFSGTPTTTGTFALTLRATDEKGATVARTIRIITAPNHAPTGPSSLPALQAVAGRQFEWTSLLSEIFVDADGDALDVTATGLPNWMWFQSLDEQAHPELRLFGHVPPETVDGTTYTLTFKATDPDGAWRTTTAQLKVLVNRAPNAVDWTAPGLRVHDAYDITVPIGSLFVDREGDQVSVDPGANIPEWLSVEVDEVAQTVRFHGTPTSNVNHAGLFQFELHGRDIEGLTSTATVSLSVGTDYAPTRNTNVGLPDRSLEAGRQFNFTLPAGLFVDADGDDIGLSARAIEQFHESEPGYEVNQVRTGPWPSWLHFDGASRTFSGQPPVGTTEPVIIRVTAYDGRLLSVANKEFVGIEDFTGDADFHINFTPYQNRTPIYQGGLPNRTSNIGVPVSWALPAGSFVDPDGDPLGYALWVEIPEHRQRYWNDPDQAWDFRTVPAEWVEASGVGLAIDAASGRITGTPAILRAPDAMPEGGWSSYRARIVASDANGASDDGIFGINLNLAPVVTADFVEIGAGRAFSQKLPITDPNGDALSYSVTLVGGGPLPSWMTVGADGVLSGTAPSSNDSWELLVTATDPDGLGVTATIAVHAINYPPEYAGGIPATLAGAATVAFSYQIPAGAFSDPNGDTLNYGAALVVWIPPQYDDEGVLVRGTGVYSQQALPSWLSFTGSTRTLSSSSPLQGVYQVRFFASDGSASAVVETTLSIGEAPNYAPTPPNLGTQSAGRNQYWSYQVPAFSDVNGDTLTYSAGSLPTGITFNAATRTFSGTVATIGNYTLKVTANDGNGGVSSASFVLQVVNKAPVAPSIPNRSAAAETAWSYQIPAFSDPNGDALSYSVSGLPSWMSFNAATRTLSGTPGPVGNWSITVTASDPSGASATRSFTVSTPNAAPRLVATLGNRSAARNVAWSYQVPVNAFDDPNGDSLSYTASGLPAGISFNASTRTFSGTVATLGGYTITVTAHDGRGQSASTSFVLSVVNSAPTYNGGLANRSGVAGQSVSWALPGGVFSDRNGDALGYTLYVERPGYYTMVETVPGEPERVWVPPAWYGASAVNLAINASSGTISGTLERMVAGEHSFGSYRLKIVAKDPSGAAAEGVFSCAINTAPTAPTIYTQYVKEELSFTKTLPAFGDIDGHALSYSLSGLPGGVVFNASTRVISGKPTVPGNYTLTYTANDGHGGVTSKTFTLVVLANTRPTAPAIPNHSITQGQAWSYYVPAFSDADNDPLTYTATGLPTGLVFTASNRRISGTPSQTGTWTVTVTANDGRGGVTSKAFTITVKAAPIPNRAPVVSYPLPDRAVNGGSLLDYTFAINSFTDPDGNALAYTAKQSNGAGLPSWLTFNASQRRFTGVPPNPSTAYTIDIRVTATDPKGLSANDVFRVTVRAASGGGGGGGPYGPMSVSQPLSFDMGQAVAPEPMVVLDPVEQTALDAGTSSLVAPELTEHWYTYDAENRLKIHNGTLSGGQILVDAAFEDSYELLYDSAGREVARYSWSPDGQGNPEHAVHRTVWDLRGRKAMEYHADVLGLSGDGGVSTRYWYDASGRLRESRSYFDRNTTREYVDPEPDVPTRTLQIGGWLKTAEQMHYDADGRLTYQQTFGRADDNWWQAVGEDRFDGDGVFPDQANDLSVLQLRSEVLHSKADNSSGYDAAGRATTYRYRGADIGWATHTYTTSYQGWESYREKTVSGSSTDTTYKATTNTLVYDGHGRLVSQRDHTGYEDGALDDRIRYYAYTGDGAVQLRRSGTITDTGAFQQDPDGTGVRDNALFVHAGGQQQAQLREGGHVRLASGYAYDSPQLQSLNGAGRYQAGGGKIAVQSGETLRTLAQRVYGNANLWYVLADANGLSDPEQALTAGTQLDAPSLEVNKNDAGTFKPYNPNEAIGSTTPSLPYIPPPPKNSCNALAMVLIVVVVVAAAVMTGGAILAALPTVGSLGVGTAMAIGAAAGAAGALAGQVAGSLLGVSSFSWRSVAAGAVTGAITGGLGEAIGAVATSAGTVVNGVKTTVDTFNYGKAAAMAVGGALSNYAGQKIAGVDTSFSWKSIAASAVAGFASSRVGYGMRDRPAFARDMTAGAAGGVVSGATRRAMGMGSEIDYASIAADAFGNALGSAMGNAGVRGVQKLQANRAGDWQSGGLGNKPSLADPNYRPEWLYGDDRWGAIASGSGLGGSHYGDGFDTFYPNDASGMHRDAGAGGGDVPSSNAINVMDRQQLLTAAKALEDYGYPLNGSEDISELKSYIQTYSETADLANNPATDATNNPRMEVIGYRDASQNLANGVGWGIYNWDVITGSGATYQGDRTLKLSPTGSINHNSAQFLNDVDQAADGYAVGLGALKYGSLNIDFGNWHKVQAEMLGLTLMPGTAYPPLAFAPASPDGFKWSFGAVASESRSSRYVLPLSDAAGEVMDKVGKVGFLAGVGVAYQKTALNEQANSGDYFREWGHVAMDTTFEFGPVVAQKGISLAAKWIPVAGWIWTGVDLAASFASYTPKFGAQAGVPKDGWTAVWHWNSDAQHVAQQQRMELLKKYPTMTGRRW